MYEQGVRVSIGGREHYLVFSLAALLAVKEKYGGLQAMAEVFSGPDDNEWDSEDVKSEKAKARTKAQENVVDELPWLIATLATQGLWLDDPKAEEVSAKWVALHILPKDLGGLMLSANKAIAVGMGAEHGDAGPRDPVLEELDRKNAGGAGAN